MGKLFGIVFIVVAIYLGMSVYEKGVDRAFGGIFAGSEKRVARRAAVDDERAGSASSRDPDAASPGSASRGPVTERVRERVTGAMEQGARRSGGP